MNRTHSSITTIAFLVAVALAATSCSTAAESSSSPAHHPTTSTTSPATTAVSPPKSVARPTADVDRTVLVEGHKMHLTCQGRGARTVLLIAGFSAGGESWDPIVPDVANETRVCSYDRFGTGSSDPAPAPQTFQTQARSLHALLAAADEPGPYVTVGHSFGGLVAATFTSMYPEDVQGLLLLDASPVDWNTTLCSVPDLHTSATDSWVTTCAMQADPAQNPESLDGPKAFAEAAQINDLGSVSLIVDQAADEGYGTMGLPSEVGTRLTDVWDRGQSRWASLSSRAQLHRVPETGHNIHLDNPDTAVAHILELVDHR